MNQTAALLCKYQCITWLSVAIWVTGRDSGTLSICSFRRGAHVVVLGGDKAAAAQQNNVEAVGQTGTAWRAIVFCFFLMLSVPCLKI